MSHSAKEFFKEFSVDIIENVTSDSILDQLHHRKFLTDEERHEDIRTLKSVDGRRQFVKIMKNKDLQVLPIFLEILEKEIGVTGGQADLVRRMREYMGRMEAPPDVTVTARSSQGLAGGAADVGASSTDSNLAFKVEYYMLTTIEHIISEDEQALEQWCALSPKLLVRPSDRLTLKKMIKDSEYTQAIYFTLTAWVGTREFVKLQQLIDVLEQYQLGKVVGILKRNADRIRTTPKD